MTTLFVCMAVVIAWFCVNVATILWLLALSTEVNSLRDRLDRIEGRRGGLDITPPPDRSYLPRPSQLVCRRGRGEP